MNSRVTESNATDAHDIATDTAAVSAPDVAPTPSVAGDADAARTDRHGAVWAALLANPGGSATAVGAEAGISRVSASKILNELEAEGRVTRTAGGHDGRGRTPDRWFPVVSDADNGAADECGSDSVSDAPVGSPATGAVAAPDTPDTDDNTDDNAEADADGAATVGVFTTTTDAAPADLPDDNAPDTVTGDSAASEFVSTDDFDASGPAGEEILVGVPGDESDSTPDLSPAAVPAFAVTAPTGEADEEETAAESPQVVDPAWTRARAELLELADLLTGAVAEMDGEGDRVMALGRLEMFIAKSAQAHRNARAVLTGVTTARPGSTRGTDSRSGGATGTAAVRPGALRDRVLAHLTEHPGKDFTPYEIGRVLDSSSGAVANALDRLVSLGQAELTCERPRRFTVAAGQGA
ncbi:hypothetical protein DP939_36465 [Spongiactinospora rosea]|uniref:MarR family protein n=1 Tax=Spongiactinospora rosea TaxID=2248750 RepID=A0A366LND0_9ACTN|nr:helix-turn-helix domain-containing protein [Spongiactinospora rosea]RBQ15337.1 hypothetical protein DP939_36465 [Spongiactinospora rosea]